MAERAEDGAPRDLVRTQSIVLSGLYAWAATVLYPAQLRGASTVGRVLAGFTLATLAAGVVLSRRSARLGRALSLYGFVTGCALSWAALGPVISVERLEPVRAALGGFGWVLFAFSWGAPREPREVPEDDPHVLPGDVLSPRGALPRGASWVLSLATLGAAAPLVLAWRVTRPSHALLSHAVAVVCAVALVTGGSEIAVSRGRWSPVEPPLRRVARAGLPLIVLGIVILAGLVGWLSG